jgi:hypothetical protein
MIEKSQKFPVKFPVLREFEDQRRYAGDDRFEIVSCPASHGETAHGTGRNPVWRHPIICYDKAAAVRNWRMSANRRRK